MGVVASKALIQPEVTNYTEPTKLAPFRKMKFGRGICRQDLAINPFKQKNAPMTGAQLLSCLLTEIRRGHLHDHPR